MDRNKYSKILTIALVIVIVAIIGVLGYLGYKAFSDKKTEENYTQAANEFEQSVTGSGKKADSGNSK